ncbi:hypothetical protein JCM3765_002897 [Sporobolomyces pararoseus]
MASSRLKRKIEVADQGGFGNLNESFVSIGTPLPALTENKKDKNEFKPVWEQEVYDEQGRRRLHGAFTGGFSAGYYNTVGSKEGWTPSTFKSSRSNRASNSKRDITEAAKDFMDEEDLAELASSRTVETNKTYGVGSQATPEYDPLLGNFGSISNSSATPTAVPSFDDTLSSLIQPSSTRVGLRLMRNMGWREGQGIGPRISYQQRKQQALEIGIKLLDDDEEHEGEAGKHLYAPLDRPLILVKGNTASTEKGWGLGYQPGATLNAQLKKEGVATSDSRRIVGGYGVEEDPYGDDESGNFVGIGSGDTRTMRVLDDLDDDEGEYSIAGSSRGHTYKKPATRKQTSTDVFHDGTPVLPGFSLQHEASNLASTSQLPPAPPSGWKPDPSRLWNLQREPISSNPVKGKGKQLDADERGTLLGEEAPAPVPKSVFDYLSAKSRDRLASLTQTSSSSSTTQKETASISSTASRAPPEPEVQLFVPSLDRPTALAALKGFQPYSAASTSPDPVKQARYTLYLQYQASGQASTSSSPFGPRKLPNGKMQTVEELNRELSEYAQSARVFKPVSGMLGNRFESSKSGSLDAPKVEPGLYQPTPKSFTPSTSSDYLSSTYGDAATPTELPAPKLTPAQLAAREGNFGPLTRTTIPFRPLKLLCKRFGVKDPYEEGGGSTEAMGPGGAFGEATATGWSTGESRSTTTNQPIGDLAMEQIMQSSGFKQFQEASKVVDENEPEVAKGTFETGREKGDGKVRKKAPGKRPTIETVGLGDDEAQGQEILEEQKAPPDIFAAIFADSDDDSDDEEGIEEGNGKGEDNEAQPEKVEEHVNRPEDADSKPSRAVETYKSKTVADSPAEPLSLDSIASYKPSFSARTTVDASTSSANPTKKSKKSKRKVALSFDLEGEEGQDPAEPVKSKKRSRTIEHNKRDQPTSSKLSRQQETQVEEEEWEEAIPQVHPSILALHQPPGQSGTLPPPESRVKKPRMQASDLY